MDAPTINLSRLPTQPRNVNTVTFWCGLILGCAALSWIAIALTMIFGEATRADAHVAGLAVSATLTIVGFVAWSRNAALAEAARHHDQHTRRDNIAHHELLDELARLHRHIESIGGRTAALLEQISAKQATQAATPTYWDGYADALATGLESGAGGRVVDIGRARLRRPE